MKGRWIMTAHFTVEGQQLLKYDEDSAYDDDSLHVWKEAYINPESIDAIADAKKEGNSLIYLRSGDSFVVRGTPRDFVKFLESDPFSMISEHYNRTGKILTQAECLKIRDQRIQASN